MWYIYTMEYYSAIKKNKIMSLAVTWMQLVILSEVRKRQISYGVTCGISNAAQMNLWTKQKQMWRIDVWLPRGWEGRGWRGDWG